VSRAIRLFTRVIGESRTNVNHVGVIVTEDDLRTAAAVEALTKVKLTCSKIGSGFDQGSIIKLCRAVEG
jgi:hypothetical protein